MREYDEKPIQLKNHEVEHKIHNPLPHQLDAFEKLNKDFTFPQKDYRGAILALPTGAGKTFTAVYWICKNVLAKNFKVIWFAHSSYLLDQAYNEFYENAVNILPQKQPQRENLNIRVVSSSPNHSKASSINLMDDVLIITTQTAIGNFNADVLDLKGKKYETKFSDFIKYNAKKGIFIVLDEAHHAPAYGFRHLWMDIKKIVPNLYILGLTATPTHNDPTISGWLFKIFDPSLSINLSNEEMEKLTRKLILQKFLAKPKFIEKRTDKEMLVDESLRSRLMDKHLPLPKKIIEDLAKNKPRNDKIINYYYQDRKEYGKTIIFADTWPQCVHLTSKLQGKGVKAAYVISKKENGEGKSIDDNDKIIDDFKKGKYEVLINIRILTEGVNIPDVKTVFITRQTTSSILLTQMIGRAMRGENAGGGSNKSEANIVMFIDDWKGLVGVFADPRGIEDQRDPRERRIMEMVPIKVVETLSKYIELGESPPFSISEYVPIGWYQTEIIRRISDESNDTQSKEETQTFIELVMVYNNTKDKIDRFLDDKFKEIPENWSDENLDDTVIAPVVESWMSEYFDLKKDIIGINPKSDLIKLCRHIAIHGSKPNYNSFKERENYDIVNLVSQNRTKSKDEQIAILRSEFEKANSLWKVFYKNLGMFIIAFDLELTRMILKSLDKTNSDEDVKTGGQEIKELEKLEKRRKEIEKLKREIKQRDGYRCLCCSKEGKGPILQVDHIIPKFQGEQEIDPENSQTLCKECNIRKGRNAIDFRLTRSPLVNRKELCFYDVAKNENKICALNRTINFFYHCRAVREIKFSVRRSGKYYLSWEIHLNEGNNPKWLTDNKSNLIRYIKENLGCKQVKNIKIISGK